LGLNGTFSTNRLYHAFEKCVEAEKVKLEKVAILRVGNTYNIPLQ